MDLGLKDKVALVTGAGSQIGFGKGIVLALAREGCDIVATDKDLQGAKQTAADVKTLKREAIAIKADITKRTEVNDMVKVALEKFGRIDILVNNAGVSNKLKPFVDETETDWDLNIDVNLKGALYCTQAVLPQMLERKYGKIINISTSGAISSNTVSLGQVLPTLYMGAKAALLVSAKFLAAQVAPSGINVNIIAPGAGDTGFYTASKAPPAIQKHIKEMAAAGRTTTPQDIGNAVAFLVSDVSKIINGQVLSVY